MAYHHPSYWNCFLMFLWGIPPFLDNTNIILFGFLYHSYAILPMKSSWNPRLPRCGWSRKQPENGASLGGARWCPFSVKLSREPWEKHTVFGGIPMVKPWKMVMQWEYEWIWMDTCWNNGKPTNFTCASQETHPNHVDLCTMKVLGFLQFATSVISTHAMKVGKYTSLSGSW